MERRRKHIHRGALLEEAVRASAVNISQMVKRMGIARGTYYNHKNDPALPLEQLLKYGRVIHHDFSEDIPEIARITIEEPHEMYNIPKTLGEAIKQRDYWKEKYYQLLDSYHKIALEKRAKRPR